MGERDTKARQRFVSLKLLSVFLLVKLILVLFSDGWFPQVVVPLLLAIIALWLGGKSFARELTKILRSPPDWADGVCLFFFIFPLIVSATLFSESMLESLLQWRVWLVAGSSLFSIVLAPIAEEMFFRGWLLKQQLHQLSHEPSVPVFAQAKIIYVNALVFWLMHAPVDFELWRHALSEGLMPMSPGPFLLGVVVAVLALKTGHLRAAILFHAIANSHGPLWWPILKYDWLRHLFYQ